MEDTTLRSKIQLILIYYRPSTCQVKLQVRCACTKSVGYPKKQIKDRTLREPPPTRWQSWLQKCQQVLCNGNSARRQTNNCRPLLSICFLWLTQFSDVRGVLHRCAPLANTITSVGMLSKGLQSSEQKSFILSNWWCPKKKRDGPKQWRVLKETPKVSHVQSKNLSVLR